MAQGPAAAIAGRHHLVDLDGLERGHQLWLSQELNGADRSRWPELDHRAVIRPMGWMIQAAIRQSIIASADVRLGARPARLRRRRMTGLALLLLFASCAPPTATEI